MEKIKKNWHIIIILLLLIISITSIFLNIKFNKKNIKIKAEEQNYQAIQVTINEDLSNRNFIFNQDYLQNFDTTTNTKFGNYYIQTEIAYSNTYIIYLIQFEARQDYIKINIIATINGNNTYIYDGYKRTGKTPNITTNNTSLMTLIYTTTNNFNNYTTSNENNVNWYNEIASNFLLFETQQIETPNLTNELNTLIWSNIDNAKYELFKNNELIAQTYNTRYIAISNGTYKVRAVVNGRYSDFSNEIIISDIEEDGQYTFLTLFGNLVDSQLYLIQSMLNFEILGFNLYQLFTAILTICIIIIICKIALFK